MSYLLNIFKKMKPKSSDSDMTKKLKMLINKNRNLLNINICKAWIIDILPINFNKIKARNLIKNDKNLNIYIFFYLINNKI